MIDYLYYDQIDDKNQGTKFFQQRFFKRAWVGLDLANALGHRVGEIGAGDQLSTLESYEGPHERFVIDGYDGSGNGVKVPPEFPSGITLLNTVIGDSRRVIEDNFFKRTYSISVLEHIGGFKGSVQPIEEGSPVVAKVLQPAYQKFWSDLYRVTEPGGETFHTVDAGVRSIPFCWDLALEAGWEPLMAPTPQFLQVLPDQMVADPNAIRQHNLWNRNFDQLKAGDPVGVARLVSFATVLVVGFRKPVVE
tara:strand:+ start:727 stop:1473 length:747 start_codon:yes stop_codon:yes gene_type:complete